MTDVVNAGESLNFTLTVSQLICVISDAKNVIYKINYLCSNIFAFLFKMYDLKGMWIYTDKIKKKSL